VHDDGGSGGDELGGAVAQLARALAAARAEATAARRALGGARTEASDLRRERDRLLELLVRQEGRLAHAEAVAPAPMSPPTQTPGRLLRTAAGIAARLRRPAPSAPQPEAPPPAPRSPPAKVPGDEPPLVPFARDGAPPRPVLLAAVQGLVAAELERLVGAVQARTAEAGVHVVFVTDCAELALFRRRGALVEYLPPPAELERLVSPDEAAIYLARRLDLLRRKWGPVRILAYGEDAAAWLARLAASPEAADVRPLVAVGDKADGAGITPS
jgi:hypothetical protein